MEDTLVIDVFEENEAETTDVPETEELSEPIVDVTPVENGNDELLGKVVLAAGAAAVGCGIVYWKKHKNDIKLAHARKVKEREEKKQEKTAKKIEKANATINQFDPPETCECVETPVS